jgi:hypothetical protein
MRFSRSGVLLCLLLLNISVSGQQTQQATTPTQDPQAVSVLNQALTVAGGAPAILAIQDYMGSGSITYPEQDAQGTVTVLGLRGTEFRMDANLPAGMRSWAVDDGVITSKSEAGTIWSMALKEAVPSSDAFPFQTPLFPASIAFPDRQLAAVVGNPSYELTYKGVVQIDGHTVYDIQLRRSSSQSASGSTSVLPPRSKDIFVDTTSFQVVKVSDTLPKGVQHELHYSDYRPVVGVLMPFSITEDVAGQEGWTVQLSQIIFNTGLQEASFVIQ